MAENQGQTLLKAFLAEKSDKGRAILSIHKKLSLQKP
jgi:hypothetical protein